MTSSSLPRRRLIMAGASVGVGGIIAASSSQKAVAAIPNKTTLSVFHFGAVGDGVTDDSAAFSAALRYSAKNGQAVLVPGYIYAIKTPITWTSVGDVGQPWGFISEGATLVSSLGSGQNVMTLTSRHTVRYFKLIGAMKIQGSGSDGCGLHIRARSSSYYFYNACIDGLSVEGVGKDGLFFDGCVFESTIMNSYFQDSGRNGATFGSYTASGGGICSAINAIGCFFNQNGQYGLCATALDAEYGGCTDVRVYGGYCRDNQNYGFYYNNGTDGGTTIEQVGFENNCKAMAVGSPNGAHVYGLVAMQMRSCSGYSSYGGATNLLAGWFTSLVYLDGCDNWSAATANTYVVTVNGSSSGHVVMSGCSGGLNVASGSSCTWEAVNCTGLCPTSNTTSTNQLNIRGTVTSS